MSTAPRTVRAEDLTPALFDELGGSAGVYASIAAGTLVIVPRGGTAPTAEPDPTPPAAA